MNVIGVISEPFALELLNTVRVKIITGSLATLEPQNYRCRYCLEIRMRSLNYHYRYRLGVRSHPFISFDSQLYYLESNSNLFPPNYRYPYRLEMFLN